MDNIVHIYNTNYKKVVHDINLKYWPQTKPKLKFLHYLQIIFTHRVFKILWSLISLSQMKMFRIDWLTCKLRTQSQYAFVHSYRHSTRDISICSFCNYMIFGIKTVYSNWFHAVIFQTPYNHCNVHLPVICWNVHLIFMKHWYSIPNKLQPINI